MALFAPELPTDEGEQPESLAEQEVANGIVEMIATGGCSSCCLRRCRRWRLQVQGQAGPAGCCRSCCCCRCHCCLHALASIRRGPLQCAAACKPHGRAAQPQLGAHGLPTQLSGSPCSSPPADAGDGNVVSVERGQNAEGHAFVTIEISSLSDSGLTREEEELQVRTCCSVSCGGCCCFASCGLLLLCQLWVAAVLPAAGRWQGWGRRAGMEQSGGLEV